MNAIDSIRAHPWISAIVLVCAIGGAVLTYALAPADLGPVRRVVGGLIAGVGVAALIVLTRAIGAFGED